MCGFKSCDGFIKKPPRKHNKVLNVQLYSMSKIKAYWIYKYIKGPFAIDDGFNIVKCRIKETFPIA